MAYAVGLTTCLQTNTNQTTNQTTPRKTENPKPNTGTAKTTHLAALPQNSPALKRYKPRKPPDPIQPPPKTRHGQTPPCKTRKPKPNNHTAKPTRLAAHPNHTATPTQPTRRSCPAITNNRPRTCRNRERCPDDVPTTHLAGGICSPT